MLRGRGLGVNATLLRPSSHSIPIYLDFDMTRPISAYQRASAAGRMQSTRDNGNCL